MTKEQRAKLAIEKREQEIREQREREEQAKRDRERLEREAEEIRAKERERERASRYGDSGRCQCEPLIPPWHIVISPHNFLYRQRQVRSRQRKR